MTILEASRSYENWLGTRCRVLPADLRAKHTAMAGDEFSFLRATYYRWAQLFDALPAEITLAPQVLAIGDLHVENYGTWRDAEGRLVWGVNDFDEAAPLPYLNDLMRLAASAWLAITLRHIPLRYKDAFAAIADGYDQGLSDASDPFILSERHAWLRKAVTGKERDPVRYWSKLATQPAARSVTPAVRTLLRQALPDAEIPFSVLHRLAGLGSLGRERFTAVADWRGGKVAREAKALVPPASSWAKSGRTTDAIHYTQIIQQAVRTADPFLAVRGHWIVRRLSPYCSRIALDQLTHGHDKEKLLRAMGQELGNIHRGSHRALPAVRRDWRKRKNKTLRLVVEQLVDATQQDWAAWRKRHG